MSISSIAVETLIRKRKSLRRELLERPKLLEVRVAILGGSTTNEVADFLEVLLLDKGIQPIFYQSEYNRYFEEAVVDPSQLIKFRPDIVYVCTSSANIQKFPPLGASESDLNEYASAERARFAGIWNALHDRIGCLVVQNNFELPSYRLLGNFDCVSPGGRVKFINHINGEFAQEASLRPKLFINDLNSIAAMIGLSRFHDAKRWFAYKLISTPEGSLAIAKSVAAIIGSIYGRSRKCVVLDLDNTLWGGVIGDDGPDNIKIGKETGEAEAYTAFQEYCVRLRERGVILAVCSKNSELIAKRGFDHPDSVLRLSDFSSFKANWEPKPENLKSIAAELNIGLDSLVFVDDNPVERAFVSAQLPEVMVPDVGSDVVNFISVLEEGRYFEAVGLSREDLDRPRQYETNARRLQEQSQFASYEDYLDSLDMVAEIAPLRPVYLERVAQLINKTNQFNLTTKRYTLADIEQIVSDDSYVTLYARLIDKFGESGLISVIIGRRERRSLHLDLWLMSCRVVKREVELAMLDALVAICQQHDITEIYGYYIRSEKNNVVSDHYAKLGFERISGDEHNRSVWRLVLTADYVRRNRHIKELVGAEHVVSIGTNLSRYPG
jgi:FkbH-like protein